MTVPFVKMHGAGNDFVVIDHRERFLPEPGDALFRRLCDRRRGIGADGVLLLERDPELDFAMRYFNSDGGPAEFCGNGARCLARFALDLGLGAGGAVRFRSDAGVQRGVRRRERATIALEFGFVARGEPRRVEAAGRAFDGVLVRAGVPHFVVEVPSVREVPLGEWAPPLRRHAAFGAGGANVDFVERQAPARLAMRTYERGVEAETLACGSGAIASAVTALLAGAEPPVEIRTAGGDVLTVEATGVERGWSVTLIGPAEVAYRGEWTESRAGRAEDGSGPCSAA